MISELRLNQVELEGIGCVGQSLKFSLGAKFSLGLMANPTKIEALITTTTIGNRIITRLS